MSFRVSAFLLCCLAFAGCSEDVIEPQCGQSEELCGEKCCAPEESCQEGVCMPRTACETPCEGTTPSCNEANGVCECTLSSCGDGFKCHEGACLSTCFPSCATMPMTPLCNEETNECECEGESCGAGFECLSGRCYEICNPSCDPSGPMPICDENSRRCICDETSCSEGDICIDGWCEQTCDPSCAGVLPVCNEETNVCECTESSCGANAECFQGACRPVCAPACSGTLPVCAEGGVCKCDADSCEEGYDCNHNGVCVLIQCDPSCSGTTPVCNGTVCECNATSCGVGQKCVEGVCEAVVCSPTCDAPMSFCDVSQGDVGVCAHPGDSCQDPIVLTADTAPFAGETRLEGMTDILGDPPASCLSSNDGQHTRFAGNDMVFAYTPTTDGKFVVVARPQRAGGDNFMQPALWMMEGSCGDASTCSGRGRMEGFVNTVTLSLIVDGVAGRPYFFVVDGMGSGSAGKFTIQVKTNLCDPLASGSCPAGKTCAEMLGYFSCEAPGTVGSNESCASDNLAGWPLCGEGLGCGSVGDYSFCFPYCSMSDSESCDAGCVALSGWTDVGICPTCDTECTGELRCIAAGNRTDVGAACECTDESCGPGRACTGDPGSRTCVDACEPWASTCAGATACIYQGESSYQCVEAGTGSAGQACEVQEDCLASLGCNAYGTCESKCRPSGSPSCTAGTQRCDSFTEDNQVGTCEPCPMNKQCGAAPGVCCGANQSCDAGQCVSYTPGNETCTSATPLVLGGPKVVGDTTTATHNLGGSGAAMAASAACKTGAGPGTTSGADLVYSYTPVADGSFEVIAEFDQRFAGKLWYFTTCEGFTWRSHCLGGAVAASNAAKVTISGVAGTTYYLVVDGENMTLAKAKGTFSIRVAAPTP